MVFTFRDFTFPVHPQTLEITDPARAQLHGLVMGGSLVEVLPVGPAGVKGSGVFTGEKAYEHFRNLRRQFLQGGSGTLVLGDYRSMEAVFRALSCTGRQGDSVGFTFEFVEFPVERRAASGVVHCMKQGETLWEVSARYGVEIRRLLELNPGIPTPDDVHEGEKVFLC